MSHVSDRKYSNDNCDLFSHRHVHVSGGDQVLQRPVDLRGHRHDVFLQRGRMSAPAGPEKTSVNSKGNIPYGMFPGRILTLLRPI